MLHATKYQLDQIHNKYFFLKPLKSPAARKSFQPTIFTTDFQNFQFLTLKFLYSFITLRNLSLLSLIFINFFLNFIIGILSRHPSLGMRKMWSGVEPKVLTRWYNKFQIKEIILLQTVSSNKRLLNSPQPHKNVQPWK